MVSGSVDRCEIKTCEGQKECRDEALELVEQFEPFITVGKHKEELKEREETRSALEDMLKVIEKSATYIKEHTSNGIIGMRYSMLKITYALIIV